MLNFTKSLQTTVVVACVISVDWKSQTKKVELTCLLKSILDAKICM